MSRIWSCYCHAICPENTLKRLKILEIHSMKKTEKQLQILRFLRFSEYIEEPAFMFPKPRSRVRFPYPAPKISRIRVDSGDFFCHTIKLRFLSG